MGVAFPEPIFLAMGCRPNRNRIRLLIFCDWMFWILFGLPTFANLRLFTSVCYLLFIYLDVKSTGGMILFASMFSPALPMVVPEKEPQELGCDLGAWKLMNAGVTVSGSYGTFRLKIMSFHFFTANLGTFQTMIILIVLLSCSASTVKLKCV